MYRINQIIRGDDLNPAGNSPGEHDTKGRNEQDDKDNHTPSQHRHEAFTQSGNNKANSGD
ncbi:hypothetical protein ES703_115531 [subsurface metagenome]